MGSFLETAAGRARAPRPISESEAPALSCHHFGGLHHFDLLNHPAVYGAMQEWLGASPVPS